MTPIEDETKSNKGGGDISTLYHGAPTMMNAANPVAVASLDTDILPTKRSPVKGTIPSLESVQLDANMTEEERAAMIKKRNAVYSKRKYYKKKKGVSILTVQRKELEGHNASLKQENRRLQCLLADCQSKVDAIERTRRMDEALLQATRISSSMAPAIPAWARNPSFARQFPATFGMARPAPMAMSYPDVLQSSLSIGSQDVLSGSLEAKLDQMDTRTLLAFLQNRGY